MGVRAEHNLDPGLQSQEGSIVEKVGEKNGQSYQMDSTAWAEQVHGQMGHQTAPDLLNRVREAQREGEGGRKDKVQDEKTGKRGDDA